MIQSLPTEARPGYPDVHVQPQSEASPRPGWVLPVREADGRRCPNRRAVGGISFLSLCSREGGSPVWTPAFAGVQPPAGPSGRPPEAQPLGQFDLDINTRGEIELH